MKRPLSLAVALAVVLACALPAFAGEPAKKEVKMTGWVSDECCALKNANADGKGCIIACHKNGSKLVFVSEGKVYKLADEKKAIEHVGQEIQITGTLTEDGTLAVTAMEPTKSKA